MRSLDIILVKMNASLKFLPFFVFFFFCVYLREAGDQLTKQQSGAVPPVDILRLGAKNIKLARPVVNNYVATREELERYGKELLDMVIAGKVQVPIHKIYDLADAASAHRDLEGRKTVGKLLIKTE